MTEDVQRILGRLEGKLDQLMIWLAQLQESQEKHDTRLTNLEQSSSNYKLLFGILGAGAGLLVPYLIQNLKMFQ